jgi:hypothetical protein
MAYMECVEELQDLRAWLKNHLAINIINRSIVTGVAAPVFTGTAVVIPEWDVRQKVEEIDNVLLQVTP